ncbi:hypothetical protein PHYC_02018 [Phycisphaerales bacterium]|nr:hypothetical protein PHYC_02018 [Phycisphaerales bacterium]
MDVGGARNGAWCSDVLWYGNGITLAARATQSRVYKQPSLSSLMSNSESGFMQDGVYWKGTREELEVWTEYKRRRALAFVERGYCVAWSADGSNWMDIFLAERPYAKSTELRAELALAESPGVSTRYANRVRAITMYERVLAAASRSSGNPLRLVREERVRILYNDGSPRIDLLHTAPQGTTLYDLIMDEFG